ncbi:MAG: hypothetical protein ACREUF_07590 [Solimonas sp.]
MTTASKFEQGRPASQPSQSEQDRRVHQEEVLDEELDESYPASDPPAFSPTRTGPHTGDEPEKPPEPGRKS